MSKTLSKNRFFLSSAHYQIICGLIVLSCAVPSAFAEEKEDQKQTASNSAVLEKEDQKTGELLTKALRRQTKL